MKQLLPIVLCLLTLLLACAPDSAQTPPTEYATVQAQADPLTFPAWDDGEAVWRAAWHIMTGDVSAERLHQLSQARNPIIAQAAIDRLGQGNTVGNVAIDQLSDSPFDEFRIRWRNDAKAQAAKAHAEPFTVQEGKLHLTGDEWRAWVVLPGWAVFEKSPLYCKLPAEWIASLNGAAVSAATAITNENAKRLTAGRPQVLLAGVDGRVIRLWADGTLAGPHNVRVEGGLWRLNDLQPLAEVERLWLTMLTKPGRGDFDHFVRMGALLRAGETQKVEAMLLALEANRPATAPARQGDIELAFYQVLREQDPLRSTAYLKKLVETHPTHPFVTQVGFFAYAHLLLDQQDWFGYRALWQGPGREAFGAIPPAVRDRLAIIELLEATEKAWAAGGEQRERLDLPALIANLARIGDYQRQLTWINQHLRFNAGDFNIRMEKATCLQRLGRIGDAEQVLLDITTDEHSDLELRCKVYERLIDLYKVGGEKKKVEWAHKQFIKVRKAMGKDASIRPPNL